MDKINYKLIGISKNGVTLCQMINHYLQEDRDLHYIAIIREPYERFWSAIKQCTYAYKADKKEGDNREGIFKSTNVADQIKEGIAQIDGTPNDYFTTQKSWLDKYKTIGTTIKFDADIQKYLKAIFKDHQYQDDIYKVIEKDWNPSTHDKDEEALGILKSTYKDKIETFYADDFKLWEEA